MNIEEYDKCVGFTPSPPVCLYCNAERFHHDLCIRHTRQLLTKVNMVKTLFSGEQDIVNFIDNALHSERVEERIESMNDAIRHLHDVDNMGVEQVASALSVSRSYVCAVLE